MLELKQKGIETDFESIYKNVVERDRIDSTRLISPLTKVADAIELDVTYIDKNQQFNLIYEMALDKINRQNL